MNAKQISFLLGSLISVESFATVYLNETQATAALFPGLVFTKQTLTLTAQEQQKIKALSGENVRTDKVLVWKASSGDIVFIDRVLGKHEMITYALGLTAGGKVKGIEILEYRESYGSQIKDQPWRAQFIGKDKNSPLKLEDDIHNIAGATLSSAHVTAGVRRLLQTYDVIKSQL